MDSSETMRGVHLRPGGEAHTPVFCGYMGHTCVLGNLSLCNHLFAFGVHGLCILVLFQTQQDVLWVGVTAEPLERTEGESFEIGGYS